MGPAIVGIVGTLLGVLLGFAGQQVQALRNRRWQKEDALSNLKRQAYTEYLRSISGSYAQALSGHRSRSEDGKLHAATAEIEILSGRKASAAARELTNNVIEVHNRIAEGGVDEPVIAEVNRRRHDVLDLFRADLGFASSGSPQRSNSTGH